MRRFLFALLALCVLASGASAQSVPPTRLKGVSTPAAGSQATVTIAAGASRQHVADCVTFSAGSTTAPALTKLTIDLRDGATGAGTVLQSWTVVVSAGTGQNVAPFGLCGLNIAGTTNTAMTLEFSASLANLFENVSLTYYDIIPPPFNP